LRKSDIFLQTDAELIDWFPGSSVYKMNKSVQTLASLAENKEVILQSSALVKDQA